MKYVNPETGLTIALGQLNEDEKVFYRKAIEQFRKNVSWLSFDEFLFSPQSPLYSRSRSHLSILKQPLYLALKDMWLQLGTQQGLIAREQGRMVTKYQRGSSARRRPSGAATRQLVAR